MKQKHIVYIIALLGIILVSGCAQKNIIAEPNCELCKEKLSEECIRECPKAQNDLYSCNLDSDCIPLPGCHPTECINKKYENSFEKPQMCTAMFACNAAYNPEDCGCINNKCVNKNLNNKGC